MSTKSKSTLFQSCIIIYTHLFSCLSLSVSCLLSTTTGLLCLNDLLSREMSGLKPTATPFLPSGSKSWADDDDEDDDITKEFAALSPKKETTRVDNGGEDAGSSTTQGK